VKVTFNFSIRRLGSVALFAIAAAPSLFAEQPPATPSSTATPPASSAAPPPTTAPAPAPAALSVPKPREPREPRRLNPVIPGGPQATGTGTPPPVQAVTPAAPASAVPSAPLVPAARTVPPPAPSEVPRPAQPPVAATATVPAMAAPPVAAAVPSPEEAIPASRRYPKKEPIYYKFLDSSKALDRAILDTLTNLGEPGARKRSDLHNDLGVLLLRFGFEKDSRDEIEEALDQDGKNYTAWYNLGLLDELAGNDFRAILHFRKCLSYRPGHADALFHLGLNHEKHGRRNLAIEAYSKAYRFESRLLDPRYNPQILDTKLVAETLATSGPTRSLAKALPMEIQDGSRINGILQSRNPGREEPPPAPAAPVSKEIGSKDLEPGKGSINRTPATAAGKPDDRGRN